MQENKFEKGVQQQVEGLRIRPSEAVWEKVEEELRKKKKRRVVFFIFLLAGLSLIGGFSGYFIFNNSKPNLVQQHSAIRENDQSSIDNPSSQVKENSIGNKQIHEKENPLVKRESGSIGKKINATNANEISINDKEPIKEEKAILEKHGSTAIKKKVNKSLPATLYKDDALVKNNSIPKIEKLSLEKEKPEKQLISKADISQPFIEKSWDQNKQIAAPKISSEIKKDSVKEELAANKEETPAAVNKKKNTSKINWGIELSGGISSNRENAFSLLDAQKSLDRMYSAPQSNAGSTPGIFYLPSSIQSGPAFRAGLVAEMKISKKSSVSSGLRYAYFSNSIKVGAYKDTSVAFSNSYSQSVRVDAIYRGFQQKEYNNRFHFIQLPLQYQLQLNKGIKLPILWNIGASAGYLVSTNGLVYDTTANGIYYHDKAAFNKFHWSLNTGFSFRFGNHKKIQWSLGPELSLGMNKLTKDDYTRKQYLLYGGMTGRIIFAKKNK